MENAHSGARVPWQVKAAAAAVLALLIVLITQYLKLKHLPGPFYGGDLYAHHGFAINYIANGFWSDPYFVGHYAFYPWLGNYLFIALSLLPGISLMQAEMYVGALTTLLSAIAFYFLGWQLFKNHTWSFVFLLLTLATRGLPDGAPNLLPWMITIPLWFAFWLKAEETGKMRDKMLAGVFMGATALSHVAFFLAGMALFGFTIVVETIRTKKWLDAAKLYGPMLAVGFVVSLLFYGPLLVTYHGKTLNPLFDYNGPNIDTLGIGWMLKTLFRYTLDFSSLAAGILSALTVLGLALCAMNWNKKTARYAMLWYVAGALAPLHHLVTRPLLGKGVLPGHLWGIGISLLIFAVYGTRLVAQIAEKKWLHANAQRIVLVAVFILALLLFRAQYNNYRANPWTQFGERLDAQTKAWHALGDWMQKNTDANAVVLSHDESCFALNGVSGRKCVFVRRTHANYFVDIEQRYADGVVMLYGNNSALTRQLLRQYGVTHFLADNYMFPQSPVLVETRFADYLRANNVSFTPVHTRKDVATPTARTFDLLAVPVQPLNKELQNRSNQTATFMLNDQPYLQLLTVRP